jgi:hypothetical protein
MRRKANRKWLEHYSQKCCTENGIVPIRASRGSISLYERAEQAQQPRIIIIAAGVSSVE